MKGTNRPSPGQRRHPRPWQCRDFPDSERWTVHYAPTNTTVAITSYEQLGGIISGRRRHAKAMKRARQVRQLYRSGFTRERVMEIVGISRSTFFRYLTDAWNHTDRWVRGHRVPQTMFGGKKEAGTGRWEGMRRYFNLKRLTRQNTPPAKARTDSRDRKKAPTRWRLLPSGWRVPEGYDWPPPRAGIGQERRGRSRLGSEVRRAVGRRLVARAAVLDLRLGARCSVVEAPGHCDGRRHRGRDPGSFRGKPAARGAGCRSSAGGR